MAARKAREILKSRGYTDADLDALPILTDARFISALEAEEAERVRLQGDLDATVTWYNEKAKPAIDRAVQDATTARAEKARLEAQIKAEQDYGMRRVANQDADPNSNIDPATGKPRQQQQPNSNERDPRYVDVDTFNSAADQFGEAIATATDIAEDHRDVFGSRLPGGVGQLRKEYKEAVASHRFNGDLRGFWESKYAVQAKRTEINAKTQADRDAKIAADAVAKYQSENSNPFTRTPDASRNPFTRKSGTTGTTTGAQPWERGTVEQRRSERVTKFAQKAVAAS